MVNTGLPSPCFMRFTVLLASPVRKRRRLICEATCAGVPHNGQHGHTGEGLAAGAGAGAGAAAAARHHENQSRYVFISWHSLCPIHVVMRKIA